MTTVFHAWPYGRLIEIQSNLRRKKLHRTNQGSIFLGGTFSNRYNVRAPTQFRKTNPSNLKEDFSSRTNSSIFTPIAPVLSDRSNEISWLFPALKSRSHFLPQSTCLVDQIQIQKPIPVVTTDQMTDHSYSREYYHQYR